MTTGLFNGTHPADARLYNAADVASYLHAPETAAEDADADLSFRDLVARFLQSSPSASGRIDSDAGTPVRLYPFTRADATSSPRLIVLDPRVRFGRPCIVGTSTPAEDVAERFHAGEPLAAVCADLGIPLDAAEEAVRYVTWLRR